MSTATFLLLLIGALSLAVVAAVLLADRLIDSVRAADLQDRINRARWPDKGA